MSVVSVAYDSAAVIPNGTAAALFLFCFYFIFYAGEGVCSPVFFFPAKRRQKKLNFF